MNWRPASRTISTPAGYGAHPPSISGSTKAPRFPSRFRTGSEPTDGRRPSQRGPLKPDRSAEFQMQRIKSLNVDLQAKLQLKTAENNQLRVDLARLKGEHDKAIRQANLQQKTTTEQMVRTLKHAEDVIKAKEKVISRQQDALTRLSMPSTPARSPPNRMRSYNGKPGNSGEDSPKRSMRRSYSLRSKSLQTPDGSSSPSVISDRIPLNARISQKISSPVEVPSSHILDLSQKSAFLRRRQDEHRAHLQSSKKFEYHKLLQERQELEKEADELRVRLREFQHVEEELNRVRRSFSSLTLEYQTIKSERDAYYAKSANLDSLVKCMREAAEKRKELELERQEAQAQLREKQDEIKQLHKNEVVGKRKHQEVIESLESKVRELEKKCDLQTVRYEELSVEMDAIQRQASRSRSSANMTTSEVQTSPESGTSTPDSALSSVGAAGTRMVNGERETSSSRQTTPKPRLGNQKSDSGLGSSLDESISSRKDNINAARSRNLAHHPLSATVDKAVGSIHPTDQTPKLTVFVTRFAYIPAKHSPNDIHDQELELKKGEFVIVYGDMDDDGFYEAESLDGRRGLIPSNYVERLPPEELVDFHASYPNNPAITSASYGPPAISGSSFHGVGQTLSENPLSGQRFTVGRSNVELNTRPSSLSQNNSNTQGMPSSVSPREPSGEDPTVPPPSSLTLEKQMHKSIMISWSPAPLPVYQQHQQQSGYHTVESYRVFVDNVLKWTSGASERCGALIEGIDLTVCHRVSVRTRTGSGRESLDSLCTILVGKDCPVMPTQLRTTNISANSATVSWLPANSNYQHSIFVDDREFAIVPASSHRFTIPDLSASTVYRVRIVPIVPKSTLDYSSYLQACAQVEFKTLPDNVPDPPSTLQLEIGPQDGQLLLTWTPVIPQRNCDVVGYAIYADGQKVKQIDSPTGDHALLDITRFRPPVPRNLTVRTISSKNLSRDSPYLSVTEDVLLGRCKAVAQAQSDPPYSQLQTGQQSITQPLQLQSGASTVLPAPLPNMLTQPNTPNRQNTVTFREPISRGPPHNLPQRMVNNVTGSPEMYLNTAERDELSDILEETEAEAMENIQRPFFDSYGRPVTLPRRGVLRNPNRSFLQDYPRDLRDPLRESDIGPPRLDRYGRVPIPPVPLLKPFQNMAIGSRPLSPEDRGFQSGRFRSGFDPRNMEAARSDMRGVSPGRRQRVGDFYRGPYEDDYSMDRDRFPSERDQYGMQIRTSSLPQIEITKDDSFESMDSRNRAYSDREEEQAHRGPRSRYNSPPNEQSYRSRRSHSRDRSEEPMRSRGRSDGSSYERDYDELPGRKGGKSRRDMAREEPRTEYSNRGDRGYAEGSDRRKGPSVSSGNTLERKSKMVRVFRAKYDYDASMSANPDADNEELFFREGQLMKVFGEKDADGFYRGEMNGRKGLIPCNLVVEETDESAIRSVLNNQGTMDRPRHSSMKDPKNVATPQQGSRTSERSSAPGSARKMIAIYDYDSVSASPNPDVELELSFKKGDMISISGEMDEDGFYEGELNGRRGLVPSNYLRDANSTNSNSSPRPKPSLDDRSSRDNPRSSNPPLPTIREPNDSASGQRYSQQPPPQQQRGGSRNPAPTGSTLRPTGQTNADMHGQGSSSHLGPGKR